MLAPGWTSYRRLLRYQTHDVTGLLTSGENTVDVLLGEIMVRHGHGRDDVDIAAKAARYLGLPATRLPRILARRELRGGGRAAAKELERLLA